LYVNGERTCLRGFGLHEDFPVLGKGHHDAVMIRNFELLAWTGANSFRTTHYPYAEEVLDYADEQGVLVIDECAAVSVNFDFSTEATEAGHARSLTEMITRDRNHPCVIAWSLGNEGTSDHPRADAHFAAMAALSRQTDPTRPLTYITCRPEKDLALAHCDFVSINIYPGWYCLPGQIAAAVADAERTLRALHTRFDKPVLVTEFGADAIAGFHDLPAGQWSEDYQAELIVALSRKLHELPFVFGQHIWNLFDFRTAQHHIRASGNRKGVFTRERQPKLAARAVREEWARQRETGPR
jgi:beta-glucuronidase